MRYINCCVYGMFVGDQILMTALGFLSVIIYEVLYMYMVFKV